MKRKQKHNFKHVDPEQKKEVSPKRTVLEAKSQVPESAASDLKRAAISIGLFLAVLVILYLLKDELQINELTSFFRI